MTTATYIYNRSDIETAQPVSVADIVTTISQRNAGHFSVRDIYRRQLRMYRNMAQFIDRHPTMTNVWLGGWTLAAFLYVTIYA